MAFLVISLVIDGLLVKCCERTYGGDTQAK